MAIQRMCEGVITVNKIQQICTYTMYKAWSANKALLEDLSSTLMRLYELKRTWENAVCVSSTWGHFSSSIPSYLSFMMLKKNVC